MKVKVNPIDSIEVDLKVSRMMDQVLYKRLKMVKNTFFRIVKESLDVVS